LLDLQRWSYTGTFTESVAVNSIGTGQYDTALSTPQMAINPSEWDYYDFYIDGWPNVIRGFDRAGGRRAACHVQGFPRLPGEPVVERAALI
jgi:hypothetical protein